MTVASRPVCRVPGVLIRAPGPARPGCAARRSVVDFVGLSGVVGSDRRLRRARRSSTVQRKREDKEGTVGAAL